MSGNEQVITISTKTLLKVVGLVILIWFLWFVRDIVFAFFVALIFSSIIDPIAAFGARRKIPRGATTLAIFLAIGGLCFLVFRLLAPVLITEVKSVAGNFGDLWGRFELRWSGFKDLLDRVGISGMSSSGSVALQPALGQVFSRITDAVHGIFSAILILVLTFYLSVGGDSVGDFVQSFFPDEKRTRIADLIERIKQKLGYWVRGQIVLSLLVGALVYVGLLIMHIEYPLVLGVFAALMEVVPYLGPTLAAIPPIFFALVENTTTVVPAVSVLVFFVIVQQIENHFFVPKVMQKAIGLNPVVSIVAIVVGVRIGGIIGGLLAIPTVTALHVVYQTFHSQPST